MWIWQGFSLFRGGFQNGRIPGKPERWQENWIWVVGRLWISPAGLYRSNHLYGGGIPLLGPHERRILHGIPVHLEFRDSPDLWRGGDGYRGICSDLSEGKVDGQGVYYAERRVGEYVTEGF